jgi:glycosyltransferase involved in cell wall biosynthesis
MKLLYEVGSTAIGGAERVILRLAQGIRKLRPDWQLDAIVMCDRGGLETEYRETFPTLIDGPGPIDYFQSAGLALTKTVKAGGYDVCHCIDSFEQTAAAARVCPETRFVQNVFPNIEKSPFAPSAEWMGDSSLPYAALVTEFQANATRLPKIPRGRVLTIPNGIDTDFWISGDRTRDIDVIWCARTDPEKGIGMAMELVPLLCMAGLKYVIVTSESDGPQGKLRAMQNEWPSDFFHFSQLGTENLRGMFRRSKIFLSTSQVEGMPATPLEAAACGCWPLVPSIDGLAECFGSPRLDDNDEPIGPYQVSCFAYPPETNTKELPEIIKGVLEDFLPFPEPAREIACRYSVENMVNRYLALYESLVTKEAVR